MSLQNRFCQTAVAALVVLAALSSASDSVANPGSEQAIKDGNVESPVEISNSNWKASFYYLPPAKDLSTFYGEIDEDAMQKYRPPFTRIQEIPKQYPRELRRTAKLIESNVQASAKVEAILFPNDADRVLSHGLEEKLAKLAKAEEANVLALEVLTKPYPVSVGLSSHTTTKKTKFLFPKASSPSVKEEEPSKKEPNTEFKYNPKGVSYDGHSYIVDHLTRDWTQQGSSLREKSYDWIVKQLWKQHYDRISSKGKPFAVDLEECAKSPLSPVLVPGAGLGRLAFDVAFARDDETMSSNSEGVCHYPFSAEAVEMSLTQATAAYNMFELIKNISNETTDDQTFEFYPFLPQDMRNRVDSERRWTAYSFPDETALMQSKLVEKESSVDHPMLSYTVGDFTAFASHMKRGMYGSILTCFFIDTASNIYEYVMIIRSLLQGRGGVWVNLGPVHWHSSVIQPTTDELKKIIEISGFEIRHWELETNVVGYNEDYSSSDESEVKSTSVSGYRPLKFVAVLRSEDNEILTQACNDGELCEQKGDVEDEYDNLISTVQEMRSSVAGKSSRKGRNSFDKAKAKAAEASNSEGATSPDDGDKFDDEEDSSDDDEEESSDDGEEDSSDDEEVDGNEAENIILSRFEGFDNFDIAGRFSPRKRRNL